MTTKTITARKKAVLTFQQLTDYIERFKAVREGKATHHALAEITDPRMAHLALSQQFMTSNQWAPIDDEVSVWCGGNHYELRQASSRQHFASVYEGGRGMTKYAITVSADLLMTRAYTPASSEMIHRCRRHRDNLLYMGGGLGGWMQGITPIYYGLPIPSSRIALDGWTGTIMGDSRFKNSVVMVERLVREAIQDFGHARINYTPVTESDFGMEYKPQFRLRPKQWACFEVHMPYEAENELSLVIDIVDQFSYYAIEMVGGPYVFVSYGCPHNSYQTQGGWVGYPAIEFQQRNHHDYRNASYKPAMSTNDFTKAAMFIRDWVATGVFIPA